MPIRHETGIQWTHVPGYIGATWNPTTGCTRVSPGCDHCYAFSLHDQRYKVNLDAARADRPDEFRTPFTIRAARAAGTVLPLPAQYDVPFSTVQMLGEERLTEPLRKQKPHAYFVDSMADLFHEDVSDEFIDRVFAVMALAPRHLFMILTKRPERMRAYLTHRSDFVALIKRQMEALDRHAPGFIPWPLPNVWLGVSAEDQERADERIPLLLDTPAAVRFVSYEPALGPVDWGQWMPGGDVASQHHGRGLDWIIVGGESGPHARPFDVAWARSLRDQCAAAGVPFFMKQAGAWPYESDHDHHPGAGLAAQIVSQPDVHWIRLKHSHGSNPDEWPEDLRVREFPAVRP